MPWFTGRDSWWGLPEVLAMMFGGKQCECPRIKKYLRLMGYKKAMLTPPPHVPGGFSPSGNFNSAHK